MWSYVGAKTNKQWIWLALDATTREIVGVHIGERSSHSAKQLWQSLPPVYRQCAVHIGAIWYFVHHYNASLLPLNHYYALLPLYVVVISTDFVNLGKNEQVELGNYYSLPNTIRVQYRYPNLYQ